MGSVGVLTEHKTAWGFTLIKQCSNSVIDKAAQIPILSPDKWRVNRVLSLASQGCFPIDCLPPRIRYEGLFDFDGIEDCSSPGGRSAKWLDRCMCFFLLTVVEEGHVAGQMQKMTPVLIPPVGVYRCETRTHHYPGLSS